jgi:hypothetical protein
MNKTYEIRFSLCKYYFFKLFTCILYIWAFKSTQKNKVNNFFSWLCAMHFQNWKLDERIWLHRRKNSRTLFVWKYSLFHLPLTISVCELLYRKLHGEKKLFQEVQCSLLNIMIFVNSHKANYLAKWNTLEFFFWNFIDHK